RLARIPESQARARRAVAYRVPHVLADAVLPGTVRLSISAGARHAQSGSEQLHRCARTHGADDGHAVSAGVRSTAAVPGEGARVVALARFRATCSRRRTGRLGLGDCTLS